jgi:hypothetical protein
VQPHVYMARMQLAYMARTRQLALQHRLWPVAEDACAHLPPDCRALLHAARAAATARRDEERAAALAAAPPESGGGGGGGGGALPARRCLCSPGPPAAAAAARVWRAYGAARRNVVRLRFAYPAAAVAQVPAPPSCDPAVTLP